MKVKTYFSSIAFYFSPPTEKKNGMYICTRLDFEKIHRPEAETLAYKVGKYEKVTVD